MEESARRSFAVRLRGLIRANRLLILAALALVVFALLLEDVLAGEVMRLDKMAYALIVERLRAPFVTPVMEAFSALGTVPVLLTLLLVIAAFAPGRSPERFCALNLALVVLVNVCLKALVRRPRPEGFRLASASGFSFPSGHSMVAMAFFGLIVWFVWRYETDRRRRDLLTVALSLVILMVGVSRVYLGVHYASDVLAGFCASFIWLVLYTRIAAPLLLGEGEHPDDGPQGEPTTPDTN